MMSLRLLALVLALWVPLVAPVVAQETPAPAPPPSVRSDEPPPVDAASLNHRLAPGDSIEVRVFQEPDLDAKVTLSKDGRAALPLVGEVSLGRLTTTQAATAIVERYKKGYLKNPRVTVSIVDYARQRFTILGAISKPGSYFMPTGESLTLLQVIGMAGGYTRAANPSKVTIQRGGTQGRVIEVDAKRMARSSQAPPFRIEAGDVITVAESLF
ncbi:MAG: polysaccharide biosynthesis/export family protein [Verrucomicrobiales bacterium]